VYTIFMVLSFRGEGGAKGIDVSEKIRGYLLGKQDGGVGEMRVRNGGLNLR
jgi:hypothetical protein